jgi:hypothetical protein
MQDTSELTAALTDCEDGADFSCDFLVKGSGSMGCGFTDALIAEDSEAQVIIVDERASPGGHWNDAYYCESLTDSVRTVCGCHG